MKNFPRVLRHGSGVEMTLDPSRLLIAFNTQQDENRLASTLRQYELVREGTDEPGERQKQGLSWKEVINHTNTRIWVRNRSGDAISDATFERLQKAFADELEFLSPVYQVPGVEGRGGMVSPLANVLLMKAAAPSPRERNGIASLAKKFGLRELSEKSKYLGGYHYFVLPPTSDRNAYQVRDSLVSQTASEAALDIRFENMPMLVPVAAPVATMPAPAPAPVVPITAVPNDPLFAEQWDMSQIDAPSAWDIATGTGMIVAILDTGCDLNHPDLQFFTQGVNLGNMTDPGSPTGSPLIIGHGTCCAGIAAAKLNNSEGIAGVAGAAQVLPIAFQNWTDAECAAGISYAAANGARALSMSFGQYAPGDGFGPTGWDFTVIDPAISNAVNVVGMVLAAATGNENTGTINRYPARNPLVIACGGSDRTDARKRPTSPDGECWGANFGPGITVVAPAIQCPATDIHGATGFNDNSGGPKMIACVNYPSSGDAAGDYFLEFNGTSSATPHVAGLATLLASAYPGLSGQQIRNVVERTASKVGGGTYSDVPGFPNGSRTAELGYGRIECFHALDFGDVMIRDWSGDAGVEPSAPPSGDFWDFSDIVVRPTDDNIFLPNAIDLAHTVTRGQTNYIYVRLTNIGPQQARNVNVSLRITPYVGLQFIYPDDWTLVDANHVNATAIGGPFASLAAGSSVIAKFTVTAAQVDQLWGWISNMGWHPCLLAQVTADNDYAFAASAGGGGLVTARNNLAQRNLTVVPAVAGATVTFPFVMGHPLNREEVATLAIDRSRLPKDARLMLSLQDAGKAFPNLKTPEREEAMEHRSEQDLVFLDRTRVRTRIGRYEGVFVLEKGSGLTCVNGARQLSPTHIEGGHEISEGNEHMVEIENETAIVTLRKDAEQMYPLSLRLAIPEKAKKGEQFLLRVSQKDAKGTIVGGATAVYVVE